MGKRLCGEIGCLVVRRAGTMGMSARRTVSGRVLRRLAPVAVVLCAGAALVLVAVLAA